jgi:murein DD-endopeptidase MepM/ murein hydrolase activator NlpD
VKGQTLYIRSGRRPFRRSLVSRLGTLALLALALLINYLVFFRSDHGNPPVDPIPVILPSPPQQTPALPVSDPADEAPAGEDGAPAVPSQVFAGALRSGDRVLDALERIGLDRREGRKVVAAMEGVFDFRNARPGDRFHVQVDPTGRVDRFEYTRSLVEIYEVTRSDNTYRAARREVRTEVETAALGCVVRGAWRESLLTCTHDADLASAVNDLLAWSIDLASEVRSGDEVRVLAEKVLAEGEFLRYGDVLAVDYRGKFASARFYRFGEGDDVAWYHADGTSLERRFLRSPLKLRGDDAYAGPRVRPGLHRFKNHSGLDYPVAKGTPVVAVGAGTVGFAGPKGTSGTLVTVRHADGASTYYAHLSRLPSGLRKGSKVQPGELIGWSGDSGSTTGPKLHFAMKVDGKFVNPLTRTAEPLDRLTGREQTAFDTLVKELDEKLRRAPVVDPQTDA